MEPFVQITLEGAPQGKGRPRFRAGTSKTGKAFTMAYTPAKTRSYERDLAQAAAIAMAGRAPADGCIRLDVLALFEVPKSWPKAKRAAALAGNIRPTVKPDWDNIGKASDAFAGIVWTDDSAIVSGHVEKFYSTAGSVHFTVYVASNHA